MRFLVEPTISSITIAGDRSEMNADLHSGISIFMNRPGQADDVPPVRQIAPIAWSDKEFI